MEENQKATAAEQATEAKAEEKVKAPKKKKKNEWEEKYNAEHDQYLRLYAEYDNFRKRTDREKAQMYDMGAKDIVEKILPVIDNFERGLGVVPEDKKEDPFIQGMEKVYKQMQK